MNLTALARDAAAPYIRARPDFLIIGAQKAGTTSLHSYLARHPQLEPARGRKELQYFNFYYDRHSLGWYLSHFPYRFRRTGSLLFEATPDYLMHEAVPGRIRRDLGEIRLIAVLREPVERAYSAWRMWHHFADSKPDLAFKADPRPFARAIDEELASPDNQAEKHFHYVAAGRYAEQFAAYRRHFRPETMLILDHAEMNRDLGPFLARICDFLQIDPLPDSTIAEMAREKLWVTPKVEMTADTRATLDRLRAYYAPHNARLFDMLGARWDW